MADYLQQTGQIGSVLRSYFSTTNADTSTRSTGTASIASNINQMPTVVAVVEGKRSLESMIGIASIDTLTQEVKLIQIRDTVSYSLTKEYIKQMDPTIILFPGFDRKNILQSNPRITGAPNTIVEAVDMEYFDEETGLQHLKDYTKSFMNQDLGFNHELPVLAASACFHYTSTILNLEFAKNSLHLILQNSANKLTMDITTVKVLELLASADSGDDKRSLFMLLNKTHTRRGMRLLRSNLLQPPADLDEIIRRQNAVQELVNKPSQMMNLSVALSAFTPIDLDYTLRSIVIKTKTASSNKTTAYLESLVDVSVYLRTVLLNVPNLLNALEDLHADLFQKIYSEITAEVVTYEYLIDQIRSFISDTCTVIKGSVNYKTTKLLAINPNADPFLSIKMKSYSELLEDMTSLAEFYTEKYSRPVKLNYTPSRGYHFILAAAANENPNDGILPPVFKCPQKKGKHMTATTEKLIAKGSDFKRLESDIIKLSGEALLKLIDHLSNHAAAISNLFENIGMVDLICSLAQVAAAHDFVAPTFGDHMQATGVYNPLLFLQKLQAKSSFQPVPNDVHKLSSKDLCMVLLTGPNQSGKSCYLSGLAQIQVMAQIGSFLPIKEKGKVTLTLVNQIFTRMGVDDDYVSNSSSFIREVSQINYILQRATRSSLIIIDELGRGTSVEEGVSLCFAVAEKLLKIKALTFFATHFHDLIKLENLYPNLVCYKMNHTKETCYDGCVKLHFTHEVSLLGDEDFTEYGIDLAETVGLPMDIIKTARDLLPRIQSIRSCVTLESRLRREQFRLNLAILKTAETDWTNKKEELCQFMSGAKQQYLRSVERIKAI